MANYRVQIKDRTYEVSIQDDNLEVNGDPFPFDMESLDGKGLHVIRHQNRNIEAHVEPTPSGSYEIQIDGKTLNAEVALGFQPHRRSDLEESGAVISPMAGLIIDVLVKTGDEVKKGDTLIIQEAMKMQMKLRSPDDGIVTAISTSPGTQVEKGSLLITVQPTTR
jgi:biotin carboxyl carrier protein